MADTLGVLVAGGLGRRLGTSTPKPLAEIGGRTLLDRALALLDELCDEVVVALPPERDLPIPAARRVNDLPGFAGSLSGLVAGLAARPYRRAIVLGVDFPLMRAGALRAIAAMLTPGTIAVVPSPGSIPQPLAAVYAPAASRRLRAQLESGERATTAAVLSLEPRLLVDEELVGLEGGVENFLNVNTPEQLEAAERILAAGSRGRSVE